MAGVVRRRPSGLYELNIQSPGYGGVLVGDLDALCIDIWDNSTSSYHEYQVLPLDEAPDPGAGPMGPVRASYLASLLNNEWKTGLTPIEKSALQAAVWEVVDEGRQRIWPDGTTSSNPDPVRENFNVSTGTFQVAGDADVVKIANEMLARIAAGGASFANYLAVSDSTVPGVLGRYQDYVVRVPLPGSILLGAFAVSLAGRKLRKFV